MRIRELHLLSDNIDKTEVFYNTILDTPTEERNEKSVSFRLDNTKNILQKSDNMSHICYFALKIPHDQLLQTIKEQRK